MHLNDRALGHSEERPPFHALRVARRFYGTQNRGTISSLSIGLKTRSSVCAPDYPYGTHLRWPEGEDEVLWKAPGETGP